MPIALAPLALALAAAVPGQRSAPAADGVWGRALDAWAAEVGGPVDGLSFPAQCTAVRALRAAGPKALPHLGRLLEGFDPKLVDPDARMHEYHLYGLRAEVADAVVAIGPKALPALAEALADARPRVRAGAAFTIAGFHHSAAEVADQLRAALEGEPDPFGRVWLLTALARATADPSPHVGALLASLPDAVARCARQPAREMALIGDEYFEVQEHFMALGRLGPTAAAAGPALRRLEGAPYDLARLQRAATFAVDPPAGEARDAELAALLDDLVAAHQAMPTQHALRILAPELLPALVARLNAEAQGDPADTGGAADGRAELRAAGVLMLAWTGAAGVQPLCELAASEDLSLGAAALSVLRDVAGPEHAAHLVPALARRHAPQQRDQLELAFSSRGGAAALAALTGALDSKDGVVLQAALRCLAALAARSPELDGWKDCARRVERLGRNRDANVRQQADLTKRAIQGRPR